jgi:hypothetical protein
MHDVHIREQLGEELAPDNRITLVPSGDKVCEGSSACPSATGSVIR